MPEDANPPRPERDDEAAETPIPQESKISWLLKGKWLGWGIVILVIFSVILHVAGWFYYPSDSSVQEPLSPEIALGEYRFTNEPWSGGKISQAHFSLHVSRPL